MADKPEEDQSNEFCTLFEPVFVDSIRLRHVSTGYYARYLQYPGTPCGGYLYLSDTHNDDDDVCYFIDWEDVVVLPDLIRIKGDNGNHVTPSRDGGIRLKSTQFGTYWTDVDDSEWVLLKQPDDSVHAANTVFLPTILDGNRIILKCLGNGLFCNRYSRDSRPSGLATLNDYPDDWSSMEIEEPVISRKIYNVTYHLNDARLYNEITDSLIDDDSSNKSSDPVTSQLNLKKTVNNTTNWSTSASLTLGVKMSLTFGVPFMESGSLEVSAERTKSSDWGGTVEESLEVGSVKTISVPPMSRIKGTLMATRMSYDIPFSYTQHDVLKNGDKKTTVKNDGVFTGNNGYGYRYKIVPLPLSDGDD
ncbi:hypothetical protein MKW98_006064 [Papaver atlanticum]|uniref:Agglutinin domain-containing protein n=1 Tax=Papaver atlanticum TaxID=357466 RepID=A0AAD4XWP1_9MAGN|nr:hypothetical protein MKW98_006064 [Papaver atlanticum]